MALIFSTWVAPFDPDVNDRQLEVSIYYPSAVRHLWRLQAGGEQCLCQRKNPVSGTINRDSLRNMPELCAEFRKLEPPQRDSSQPETVPLDDHHQREQNCPREMFPSESI
jgi:hypothetical protein